MAVRVANLAANNRIVNLILRTQNRVNVAQVRVSTGKESQNYIGIANQSERLVNMENSRTLLQRYIRNNDLMELRLNTAASIIDGIEETIRDFRGQVTDYSQSTSNNAETVKNFQEAAVRAMKSIEAYLNTDVDGRFLFSGSRVTSEPVNFNFANLTDFQALYDGTTITYPTRRDTAIHPKLTDNTGSPSNPTGAGFGNLTFTDATERITAANAGTFANIPVGSSITVTGTTGSAYDATYTVSSNDGTIMVVSPAFGGSGDMTNINNVTITVNTSYYKGDERALTHRADDDRTITYDLTAVQPAFEKAIRAMGIIAQGGLAANAGRVDQAKYLLNASLSATVGGTPPFGTEQAGNFENTAQTIGFQQVLLDRAKENHATYINFLERRIGGIEDIDPLESIIQLTNDTRALEASYRALARIRELGLQDFLS
jgi:flagellin-like hook-associated protein FlgL